MPISILVLDTVSINRIRLTALLGAAQYAVTSATHVSELSVPLTEFDLLVLGLPETPPVRAICEVTERINAEETPLLCLDAHPSPLRRLLALRAGARDVLPRTAPDSLLLSRMRGLLREGEAQRESERRRMAAASFGFSEASPGFAAQARIGCLGFDDDSLTRLAAGTTHCLVSMSEKEALSEPGQSHVPDVYAVRADADYRLLDHLLPELRDRSHSRHAPVLVSYPEARADIATRALALGANDIAPSNACGEELGIRVDAMLKRKRLRDVLRQSDEQSYRLAATDPLTGLYNRRYAEAYLGDLTLRAHETGTGFVLMIVDLDRFKSVNDTHGHIAGDRVLCEVAHRLRDNLRACDLVSRHGGEEFLVILPETEMREGVQTAERLRKAISARPIMLEKETCLDVTASIGVAYAAGDAAVEHRRTGTFDIDAPRFAEPIEQIFEAADTALYRAKASGRNRIEVSTAHR